jgi:acetone carboxylase gamma subunit
MERLVTDEVLGDKFQCQCGNTEFEQDCYAKIVEKIDVIDMNGEMILVSKTMKPLEADDIEHTSEFTCPKCNSSYEVTKRDGKDAIVKLGDD